MTVSGAFSEFRETGRLGPDGARLLYETVAAVVRIHGFPSPSGAATWSSDDVEATAHDFLISKNAERRLTQLYISAIDEASFGRLLHRAVRNHLRSQARQTELGRLVRRLNEVLKESNEFRQVTGENDEAWWTLVEGEDGPFTANIDQLVAAAMAVRDVRVPRWSSQTRRQPPHADRGSLQLLARVVLEAAGGALAINELARAIAPRVGLGPLPLIADVDVHDLSETSAILEDPGDVTVVGMAAGELFDTLTERERLVLAHFDEPVRELAPRIGLGKSQAGEARQRVFDLLRTKLSEDQDDRAILRLLVEYAQNWAEHRTGGLDATSG